MLALPREGTPFPPEQREFATRLACKSVFFSLSKVANPMATDKKFRRRGKLIAPGKLLPRLNYGGEVTRPLESVSSELIMGIYESAATPLPR